MFLQSLKKILVCMLVSFWLFLNITIFRAEKFLKFEIF